MTKRAEGDSIITMKTSTDYKTTKEEAAKMGERLVVTLNKNRPGWKLQTWENLGWHYCASNKACGIRVSPSSKDGYFYAMVNPSYATFYGDGNKSFRNPVAAIKYVIKNAAKYRDEIVSHVAKFESYLN